MQQIDISVVPEYQNKELNILVLELILAVLNFMWKHHETNKK